MSRLLEGSIEYNGQYIPIEEYRDMISSRSLYSIDNEYKNTNKFSLNNKGNVASSISTVLNVVPQYNRMQVNTNLLGNTYDAFRDDGSALAKIGLIMLGKQMAYNSAMNLSTKYLPSIDLSQALKGNPENIFKLNKDNTITVKNPADKTFFDKVGSVASNVLGIDTYDVFGDANPFDKNPTNTDYLKNTGNVQLSRFLGAVNLNIYKPLNYKIDSEYNKVLTDKMNTVGPKLQSSENTIISSEPSGIRPIFNFNDRKAHPYYKRKVNGDAIESATKEMQASYSITGDTIQEYAPDNDYIEKYFGNTVKRKPETLINDVVKEDTNSSNNLEDQIVWGRDGVANEAKSFIKDLRGRFDGENRNPDTDIFNKNNIKKGILEYTRNLLNASEGNFVDITRKAFKDGNDYVGFNGSPLWTPNNSKYSIASRNYNPSNGDSRFGVRQHTILDPYDNKAKTIRYEGNIVYNEMGGNKDSVIYKNILPRIHPTDDDNGNKNLMFSLENLAIGAIKRDKYGIIDDEDGTPIPLSEVGQFGGRLMWFPPYNVQINEVATAKYESTVMVGRNEPMYNYMNSERSAVLSFSLLVDYPEQLRNLESKKENNKAIADFFAFGGDPLPIEYNIEQIEKKIQILIIEIDSINPTKQAEIAVLPRKSVNIYFPNDAPEVGQESNIIQIMYDTTPDGHYEIIRGCLSAQDGNGFGLNDKIYYVQGLDEKPNSSNGNDKYILINSVDQYNTTDKNIVGQYGTNNDLTQYLKEFFENENTRKYYNIKIEGYASRLYLAKGGTIYNKEIALRRINAAKELIEARLTALFNKNIAKEIIDNNIIIKNYGDSKATSPYSHDPAHMHDLEVKKERKVEITIERNNLDIDDKEQQLTEDQKARIRILQGQINILEEQLRKAKGYENIFNKRDEVSLDKFDSITKNKYYPAFHSQTPEDFHRRLTFLQQCTRQGAAKRYDSVDENGILRAKNSVFGRQPICILRVGDFFNTKVIIESVTIDYNDSTWDLNPEGFGLQPMIANITLQMKLIGGQSLKAPIDALQNAVSFNYYANSTFNDRGVNGKATDVANKNYQYLKGVDGNDKKNGIIGENQANLIAAYERLNNKEE